MKTLDQIVEAVRSGGVATEDEMRHAIVAFDVLLYKLNLPGDMVRLQEYFKAADLPPAEYYGEDNSPDNPGAVAWFRAMKGVGD